MMLLGQMGKERNFRPAPKYSVNVHVCAGTSKRGVIKICIFDQVIDAVSCALP